MPPYAIQDEDITLQYRQFKRAKDTFRPIPATTYTPGSICQYAALDLQTYFDNKTVQLTGTGANQRLLAGVVAGDWPGFNASLNTPPTYLAPGTVGNFSRGSAGVDLVIAGFAGVLVDQSGSGAVTITNGVPIVPSRATAGYGQGVAASTNTGPNGVIAAALLPAATTYPGYTLTAGSLAQAAAVFTVATPAAGDIVNTTIQSPYTEASPGIVQTTTWSYPLKTADAVSATTAGAAIVAFLNAQPSFSQYFIATNVAGAVTVTVNALSTLFMVTGGNGQGYGGLAFSYSVGLSGVTANLLTTAGSVTGAGGTTYSASATTFGGATAGTGYKGICPSVVLAQ